MGGPDPEGARDRGQGMLPDQHGASKSERQFPAHIDKHEKKKSKLAFVTAVGLGRQPPSSHRLGIAALRCARDVEFLLSRSIRFRRCTVRLACGLMLGSYCSAEIGPADLVALSGE